MEDKLINVEDKLINVEDIKQLLKKRLWIVLVITILTTAAGVLKTTKMVPSYTASIKFLVSTSDKLLDNYSETELENYNNYMATFTEVMRIGDFLDEGLKEKNISTPASQIKNSISYSSSSTVPVFTLYYNSYSTNEMAEILEAVSEIFGDKINEIDKNVKVTILEEPVTSSIVPNKISVILVAFIIGMIIGVGLILVLDYLDDTVGKREELEKLLPIPVLGNVPHHEREFEKESKKNVHSR